MAAPKQAQLWIVNVVSFVLFFLLAVTGLINWLVLPHGAGQRDPVVIETRHFIRDVHAWLAIFFCMAVTVHLVLHWPYIRANLVKMGLLDRK